MIVARRLLVDRRTALMWWSLGIIAIVAFVVGLYPSIQGKQGFEKLFNQLPAALKAMAGTQKGISIISPEGYLHGRLFATFAPLLLTIFGIGLGAYIVAGSEADGTLELLLSNPLTRRRLVVERFSVLVGLVVALGVLIAVTTIALKSFMGGGLRAIPAGRIFAASMGATCLALLHASLAFSVGCITGKRPLAVAAGAVVAIAGYLLHVLTLSVASLSWLAVISPWRWYLSEMIVVGGANANAIVTPLAVSAVAAIAGTSVFLRRDLR